MEAERLKMVYNARANLIVLHCVASQLDLVKKYPMIKSDFGEKKHLWQIYQAAEDLAERGFKVASQIELEDALKRYIPDPKAAELKNERGYNVLEEFRYRADSCKLDRNLDGAYRDVLKYRALRELAKAGVDISDFWDDYEVDVDKIEEMCDRLNKSSPEDIINYYKDKANNVLSTVKTKMGNALTGSQSALIPRRATDLERAYEPIEYLVDGIFKRESFNSIVGAAKAGKTQLSMAVAFCVQNGIPFLGHECKKGDVLYVDFELEHNEINHRLNLLKSYYEMPEAEVPYYISASRDFANGTINMAGILEAVREAKKNNPDLKLCIFDCYYTFAQGDGNSEEDTKRVLQPLKGLVDDMCVCYVHHTNKNSTDVTNLIYAAGGSGVHGKIVDTAMVVYPKSEKDSTFVVATTGRSGGGKKIVCKKDESTYHQFKPVEDVDDRHKVAGKTVEKNPKEERPDIWAAVGINGATVYKINKDFGCTVKELTDMGFYVSQDKKVFRSK